MNLKILFSLLLLFSLAAKAQESDPPAPVRVGLFASLYLDSAFSGKQQYKYDKEMPKHLLSGLDFTEGALIGLDSLLASQPVEIRLFDVKSYTKNIQMLKAEGSFDSLQMIIGAVSGNDYKQLSDIALAYQIPFLSATFPNDGGITKNPFTILLNPTIPVHCKGIITFIQDKFPKANIIYVTKKGVQEDKIYHYFSSINASSPTKSRLKFQTYNMADSLNALNINRLLDTTKQNLLICGSLEEKFNISFLATATSLSAAKIHLIGMPVWETLKELQQTKYKEEILYYPTSFYNDGSDKFLVFNKKFQSKTNGKPSDIAYRGYDVCYNFINLLVKHGADFINQLNDASYRQFIEYNIQPVNNAGLATPDYFENKSIYMIKKSNGTTTTIGRY